MLLVIQTSVAVTCLINDVPYWLSKYLLTIKSWVGGVGVPHWHNHTEHFWLLCAIYLTLAQAIHQLKYDYFWEWYELHVQMTMLFSQLNKLTLNMIPGNVQILAQWSMLCFNDTRLITSNVQLGQRNVRRHGPLGKPKEWYSIGSAQMATHSMILD